MGISSGNTYEMKVYFTDKGLDALYSGGLINKLKRFGLSDQQKNYTQLSDLTYQYDSSNGGNYLDSNSNPVTLKKATLIDYAGMIEKNRLIDNGKIKKIKTTTLKDIILQQPDLQTTVVYDLVGYKESEGKKYFNLTASGNNKKPVVLGGNNMWRPGLSVNSYLTYEDTTLDRTGYIDVKEPVFGSLNNGGNNLGFPGVSVTKQGLSETETQKFYIYNKSRSVVYFNSFSLSTIKPLSHRISNTTIEEIEGTSKSKITYEISWTNLEGKEKIEGDLEIKLDTSLINDGKVFILPYEVIEFDVNYAVRNPGSKIDHYRGQTPTNPDAKEGILIFNFEFVAFNDKKRRNNENRFAESIDVVVQVKDSGFDKTTFNNLNTLSNNTLAPAIISLGGG